MAATSSIVDRFHGVARIDRLIAADAAAEILTEHDGKERIYVLTVSRRFAKDAGRVCGNRRDSDFTGEGEANPLLCPREEQQLPQNSERDDNLAETWPCESLWILPPKQTPLQRESNRLPELGGFNGAINSLDVINSSRRLVLGIRHRQVCARRAEL